MFIACPDITATVSDIKADCIGNSYIEVLVDNLESFEAISPICIIEPIKHEHDIDIVELGRQDLRNANELWLRTIADNSDLIILTNIFSYGTGPTRVGEVQYKLPSTTNSIVYTPYATAHVQARGLETYTISEHDALTLYVGVRFDAVETKSFNRVMSVIDTRGKVAEAFGSSKADNMYK